MTAGRKREFDKQDALQKATLVFWKKGFVGTSLSDLTNSMGINKPSLYSAFGNKEELFVTSTEHYLATYAMPHIRKLEDTSLSFKQRILNYLFSVVEMQCNKSLPGGCFVSLCASEAASNLIPEHAVEAITKIQDLNESYLTEFFEQEKQNGNINDDLDVTATVLFIITLIHGTAVMARTGKSLEEIQSAIRLSINSFSQQLSR